MEKNKNNLQDYPSALDLYIEYMKKEHNEEIWEIGWESLPKYIGHKIYNKHTKETAVLNWVEGCPELYDKDNNKVDFCADDFRHGNAYWIYKVGENYRDITEEDLKKLDPNYDPDTQDKLEKVRELGQMLDAINKNMIIPTKTNDEKNASYGVKSFTLGDLYSSKDFDEETNKFFQMMLNTYDDFEIIGIVPVIGRLSHITKGGLENWISIFYKYTY